MIFKRHAALSCYCSVVQALCIAVFTASLGCGGGGANPTTPAPGSGTGTDGGGSGTQGVSAGPFTAGRTKYVRTDATTEYFQSINSHWIIRSPITNYIYVTDPGSNRVIVLSVSSESVVGSITVPGAFSIDDTPDHKTLYVGTQIGDVYTIDPVTLAVTHRYLSSQIGPSGYFSINALVLADGQLVLLGQAGGIPSVDGSTSIAIWDPVTNGLTLYSSSGVPLPCGPMLNIGALSRTVDRTKVIIASVDSDSTLCEIDEGTGQGVYIDTQASFVQVNFRITPDGKYIVVPTNTFTGSNNSWAYVYDAATLSLVKKIPVSGTTSTGAGFAISSDSKTLYVPNDWVIYAYDLTTGQQVGWLSNLNVPYLFGGGAEGPAENPNFQVSDASGLLIGPLEEGVGFVDTTTMHTGPVGTEFTNGYLNPATGPTSGGTQTQITEPVTLGTLESIYFGTGGASNEYATKESNLYGKFSSVTATSPAAEPGPVDVYVSMADGGLQVIPEGFSYGPTIIQVTPNNSTAEGGGTGLIYGYGFGPVGTGGESPLPQIARAKESASGIPSDLQVTVGGDKVQITGFAPYAYPSQSPPFPLQALSYTIPPGTTAADVSITTSSGSTVARSALTYLPAIQQFSMPASVLVAGVYDPHKDLYYFTDTNLIQVFSRTSNKWQSPIPISAPAGASQRLWGIAFSPDGTKMAISDAAARVIYFLDPSNPASVQTFPVPTVPPSVGVITTPCGLAVSNAGFIYYAAAIDGGTGYQQFFKLDSSTGTVTTYGINGPGLSTDIYLRTLMTADGSTVFLNEYGELFKIDTATDTTSFANLSPGCCYGDYELTVSADGTRVEANGYFYDSNLAPQSYYTLNDREMLNIGYVYGAKLSADGNLFFQPSSLGVDVYDGHLGKLLTRIALPVTLSANYDALVTDGKDNVLVAITGAGDGIAVVDLSSLKEPAQLPYYEVPSATNSASSKSTPPRSTQSRAPNQPKPPRKISHITKALSRGAESLHKIR